MNSLFLARTGKPSIKKYTIFDSIKLGFQIYFISFQQCAREFICQVAYKYYTVLTDPHALMYNLDISIVHTTTVLQL